MDNSTVSEMVNQTTIKSKATPEGMAVAYGSLVIMALIPIFYGSFKSVIYQKEQRVCFDIFNFFYSN